MKPFHAVNVVLIVCESINSNCAFFFKLEHIKVWGLLFALIHFGLVLKKNIVSSAL